MSTKVSELNSCPELDEIIGHMVADKLNVAPWDGMYIMGPNSPEAKKAKKVEREETLAAFKVSVVHSKHGEFFALPKVAFEKMKAVA